MSSLLHTDSDASSHVQVGGRSLLTAKELCQLLRVPMSTIYHYASRGVVPSIRIGGRLRFDEQQIRTQFGGLPSLPLALPDGPERCGFSGLTKPCLALFEPALSRHPEIASWMEAFAQLQLQPLILGKGGRLPRRALAGRVELVVLSPRTLVQAPQIPGLWNLISRQPAPPYVVMIVEGPSDLRLVARIPPGLPVVLTRSQSALAAAALVRLARSPNGLLAGH